jgi:hypothetical protein
MATLTKSTVGNYWSYALWRQKWKIAVMTSTLNKQFYDKNALFCSFLGLTPKIYICLFVRL